MIDRNMPGDKTVSESFVTRKKAGSEGGSRLDVTSGEIDFPVLAEGSFDVDPSTVDFSYPAFVLPLQALLDSSDVEPEHYGTISFRTSREGQRQCVEVWRRADGTPSIRLVEGELVDERFRLFTTLSGEGCSDIRAVAVPDFGIEALSYSAGTSRHCVLIGQTDGRNDVMTEQDFIQWAGRYVSSCSGGVLEPTLESPT